MKRTIIQKAGAALLALCLMGTLLPTAALAEEPVQLPQVGQPQTEQLQLMKPQAFTPNMVYNVATAADFTTAVAAITADTESGTEFTLVLTADNIDVTQFAGIEGKHITLKSSEGQQYTIGNMGTNLTGDLTLDNVMCYGYYSDIFANGHLFETTSKFKTPGDAAIGEIYGGGSKGNDVTGDTNLVLRGAVRIEMVYGGGLDSAVGGSTHVLVDDVNLFVGNLFGGGIAKDTESGTVGGDTNVAVRQGKNGHLFGGGKNLHSTEVEARSAAAVTGSCNITVGYVGATGDVAQVGTAMYAYGGSWHSTVGAVNFSLLAGTSTTDRNFHGCGYGDTVRGTVSVLAQDANLSGGRILGGGGTERGYDAYGPVRILNEGGAENALTITYDCPGEPTSSDKGHGLNTGSSNRETEITGNVQINLRNGDLDFAILDGDDFSSCTITGTSTLNISGGRVAQIQGDKKNPANSFLIYDGCGTQGAPQTSGYLYLFANVHLKNNANVLVTSKGFSQLNAAQKPFFSVNGLTVDHGSSLATDGNQAYVYGDVALNGTWEQRYVGDGTSYNDLYTKGTFTSNGGTLISHGTANLKGNVTSASGKLVFRNPAYMQGSLAVTNTELRVPALATGTNYPDTNIALQINGTATGTADVFTTEAADWTKNQTPVVGENYIDALRAGSEKVFVLSNGEEAAKALYFRKLADADTTDKADMDMWQVATGRVVTFDKNGGDTEAAPKKHLIEIPDESVTYYATLPTTLPTRAGYTFTGWNTAENGSGTAFTDKTPVSASLTVYAQWQPVGGGDTTDYYTLTYASNGGTKFPSQTYAEGTRVQLDKLPVREGYTFTGWYGDKELTQKRTEVRMDCSKTVYAGWQAGTVPDMLNGKDHFAYVVGYTDGTVRPLEDISRAEVATIFFRLLKEEVRSENLTKTNCFTDIRPEAWHNTPISTMAALGVVKGRGETVFDPDASITRAEFAAICARFDTGSVEGSSNFTDVAGHWAQAAIERAAALGWIQGYTDGSFRPDAPITRAEAMTLINRVLCRIPESESDLLKDMTIWPDNQPGVWHYLAVQEATNGHDYRYKGEIYEEWVKLIPAPDWSKYEC